MVRFELKKVLGSTGGKIATLAFVCVLLFSCWQSASGCDRVIWVNEQGDEEKGFVAAKKLHAAQDEWEGYLDEAHLAEIIRELNRIAATPEAQSKDYNQNDIAYGWKLGIRPVRYVLNKSYSDKLTDFNWYLADTLDPSVAGSFYSNRVKQVRNYLTENSADLQLSQKEQEYVINQFEKLKAPIYYDYMEGWSILLESMAYIMLLGTLLIGYLVSGIFSNEFRWHTDSVFYSTVHGRKMAVAAKIKAGFLLTTALYWGSVLILTAFTLAFYGVDGWNCAIQFDYWKSIYNLNYLQTFLCYAVSGYLGTLFMAFLTMWVSAKTNSAVFAVTVPFILIFVPNFIENSSLETQCARVLGLLPDNLMDLTYNLRSLDVYDLGFTVSGAWPIQIVIYTALTTLLVPMMYRQFRKKQIA